MKMKMKTFEVTVVITIEAEDATTASEEVEGCLDCMFDIANYDGRLIAHSSSHPMSKDSSRDLWKSNELVGKTLGRLLWIAE